jgi:enamine deaminase RidA (YjgF/YER057c/UK114 family)
MKKTIYNPETIGPPVGHFDRAVRFDNWLFVSGTSALTGLSGPMNDRRLEPGIERQTQLTLDNIEKVMQAAGGSLSDIYEMRIIVKQREHFSVVDRQLQERIPNKGYISHGYQGELLHPEMELEIEVYAYLGELE